MSPSHPLRALAVLTVAALVLVAPVLSTDAAALVGILGLDSDTSDTQESAETPDAAEGAADATNWAPIDQATVTPGVQTITGGAGQCTANFVFTDGQDVYLGQAAHCASLEAPTASNGCAAASLPTGTRVAIQGAEHPGKLVYSSWETMKKVGEKDPTTCRFNDFALVWVHPDDHDKVNPTMPFFGGPTGMNTTGAPAGKTIHTYGNSQLRLGIELLSPKTGASTGTSASGWNHNVYTVTPGIPGDSGSAVIDGDGKALGILSTLMLAPLPASNEVTDLSRALNYANRHTGLDLRLVPGTQGF